MFGFEGAAGPLVRGLVLTTVAVLWTVLLVRIVGLRGFSKMTSFDFVTTIATGSLIAQAGTRADWLEFLQAMVAIAAIFAVQWLLAKARQKSERIKSLLQNQPVLLMENGKFLDQAMEVTRVSRSSILEKIRQANIGNPARVRAVVLETTGNISVLSGDVDEEVLQGVERVPRGEA